MLGSVAEAEDVVQEALIRLHDRSPLDNVEAFLTTVTTRLSIDVLRSARVRRETYVGDGGGKARAIAKPMVGGPQVARALASFYKLADQAGVALIPAVVNGQPGFRSLDPQGRIINVVQVDVADGAIQRVHSILNPDKLGHLGLVSDLGLRPSATPR